MLVEDVVGEDDAIVVAERVLESLRVPFTVSGQPLFVTASIGIALSGPTADQPNSLLRNADLAMHQAKGRGKGCWMLFAPELNKAALERLALETALRGALDRDELYVMYQPIVDLETGEIREVEALIRWNSPEHGQISPGRFIPVAEETGLILQIGPWVLREACRQVVYWNTQRPGDALVVSVNVSGRQLQEPALVETVAEALRDTGLDASCLKLELTESVVMEDAEQTIETLGQLKALGVQLAIDDFGTGYSSLSYLKCFPVDVLKVDRSFVDGLATSQQDAAIVQGIIALAQSLGLTVTGEGIETEEQAAYLTRLGCDLAQGYYFSRPLTVAQFEALLTGPGGSVLPGSGGGRRHPTSRRVVGRPPGSPDDARLLAGRSHTPRPRVARQRPAVPRASPARIAPARPGQPGNLTWRRRVASRRVASSFFELVCWSAGLL